MNDMIASDSIVAIDAQQQAISAEAIRDTLASIWRDVLDLDRPVGDLESFFEIGGDSVSAVLVLLQFEEESGRKIPVNLFFKTPRLADFAAAIQEFAGEEGDGPDGSEIGLHPITAVPREVGQVFPLSFPQRQLWFLDQLYGRSASYNLPLYYRIEGALNIDRLCAALDGLVARHEILRTVYRARDGVPHQVILEAMRLPIVLSDLSELPARERETAWHAIATAEVAEPMDLVEGPVIRARLIRLAQEEHILVLCIHHIAFDGWSAGILIEDLAKLYTRVSLPAAMQYADYAQALVADMAGPLRERLLSYWREVLKDMPSRNDIPTDHPRRQAERGRAANIRRQVTGADFAALQTLARTHDTTLFVVLYAALSLLVSRYTRQRDVLIGTPMANRARPELLSMLGFFVNSLVLRNTVGADAGLRDFIAGSAKAVQAAFEHQALPFDLLVEDLKPERSLGQNPIFDVMFVLQNTPQTKTSFGEAKVTALSVENASAKFDILLNIVQGETGLEIEWEFDSNLYTDKTIGWIADQFLYLLEVLRLDPDAKLDSITLCTPAEAEQIKAWNDTNKALAYPSIASAFAAAVVRHGDKVAIVEKSRSITYVELDRAAERLAGHLRALGLQPGEPVGLYAPRGIDVVRAMLAVLKCGACYLPIDTTHPSHRVAFMVEDASLRFVIAAPGLDTSGLPASVTVIPADGDWPENPAPFSLQADPRSRAYLMYTSGSTGNPKGVFIPQEGILRLVLDPGYMELNDRTVMLNATSISFDTSAFEIWGALLNGGSLIVYADLFDGAAVADLMRRHKVNTIWMTSGVLEVFVGSLQGNLPDLRWMVAGGDIVPPKAVAKLYADNPKLQVVNGYGPTENSVYTCCHAIPRDLDTDRAVPIGKPINNTQVAVIDMAGQPAGIGIPGELLCMGGAVGLGYLNRDDLNAERFLPDPDRPGLLRYRSGDLVRWRPDGTIEFYGRLDNQLKIRGYRIEPAEIETALQRHPSVALGAITVHGEGASGKFLVAWVKPRSGHALDIEALRTSLASELPEPSRPAHIRLIEEVPVTANGKIDRAALAKTFSFQREQSGQNLPLSPTGHKLAAIWSELLGIGSDIGPTESLFDLGGNSLLAVRLVSRINQSFGLSLTVRTVFETPRFADQVAALEAAQTASPSDVKSQRLTRLSQGSNQTWLAFPGIGATSAAFIGLAQAMAGAGLGDIVVFEPRGLAASEAPDRSIAAIAEEAAQSWHALSKAGPCRLLGHSFGGRLAFETALLLQEQGIEAPLTLLDSLPGNELVDVSRIVADDSDDALAEWLLSAMEASIAAPPRAADAVAAIVEGGLVAAQQVSALLSLTRAQFAMNQSYNPSGRLKHMSVHLIHATQSLIGAHDAKAIIADLQQYCPKARVNSIEADHFSMLRAGLELAGLIAATKG